MLNTVHDHIFYKHTSPFLAYHFDLSSEQVVIRMLSLALKNIPCDSVAVLEG